MTAFEWTKYRQFLNEWKRGLISYADFHEAMESLLDGGFTETVAY